MEAKGRGHFWNVVFKTLKVHCRQYFCSITFIHGNKIVHDESGRPIHLCSEVKVASGTLHVKLYEQDADLRYALTFKLPR